MAEHFLFNQKDKNRIRHIDGDKTNNCYKNLICLDAKEAYNLQTGQLSLNDLKERQEYMVYVYKGHEKAVEAYNLMYKRCHDEETKRYYPQYADSTMYKPWEKDPELPYGVRYDESRDKYYAQILMDKALRDGEDKPLKLRYRDTPEEAFADYKRRKEAYIMLMADKYMKYLPVKIYDALLDYEVEPY